jgi:hypothetical protein
MKQKIICKTLAVAVIILFIGVGVQPVIATVEPKTSDNGDCDICPSLEDLFNSKDFEKFQVFYDRNTILPESIIRESICTILTIILGPLLILWWPAVLLIERLEDKSMPLLLFMAYLYWFSVAIFAVLPGSLWLIIFRCYEFIEIP